MADIDRISRKVPCLCKVAPATQTYHIEDVHRAGGIIAILGELDRAGLLDTDAADRAQRRRWATRSTQLGHHAARDDEAVHEFFRAAPGGVPTQVAFSQDRRWTNSTSTASNGCIRDPSTPSPRMAAWPC